MSTIKVNKIENTSTTDGGISIDNSGHVTVDGQQLPSAGALSNRNIFGNGACRINQGGASNTGMTGGSNTVRLCVDRFRFSINNLGTWTATSESTNGPESFPRSLKFSSTVADASPGSAEYAICNIVFEGVDFDRVDYGKSTAKPLTISFWVKSNKTGDATFEFVQQSPTNFRHYSTAYNIASANTWEHKTITIPGDTAGQIDSTSDGEVQFLWWLNSGDAYTTGSVTNNWQTQSNPNRNGSNFGLGGSTADYWQITGLQVEVGEKATPFEHRNYQDYLQHCHRYYQVHGTVHGCSYGNNNFINCGLHTRMRATPTATGTFTTGGSLSSSFTNSVFYSQYVTGATTAKVTGLKLDAQL